MNSNGSIVILNNDKEEYLKLVIDLSEEIFHDFKNNLAIISGISQLTYYQDLPKEVKENMKIIYKAAIESREQIDDFYKSIKGYDVDIYQHKSLSDIVFTCLELIKYRINKFGDGRISLSVNILSTSQVYCNEYRLRQAILNILINSLDAMEESGGLLNINLFDEQDSLVLEIIDTGIGIAEENLDRIFDDYYTTKGKKGTGVGLKISKSIIEASDGRIEVKSKLGKGTIFTVYLPIRNS